MGCHKGSKKAASFDDLSDISFQDRKRLKELYRHVDDIDIYVGGMLEKQAKHAFVGTTFQCILIEGFIK